MLSLWSKKPETLPKDDRQLHRDAHKRGDSVVYAAKNQDRGVTFAFSGPAGSAYSDTALKIAGLVYSNDNPEEDRPKPSRKQRRRWDDPEPEKCQPEVVTRAPRQAKKATKQDVPEFDASNAKSRHKLSAEDAQSVFSSASSTVSRAKTSNRHTSAPSEISDLSSGSRTQVSTSRHRVPIGGDGFKYEDENHLAYGLQNEGRKLYVSAPKVSREGENMRQIADMATSNGQATIKDGNRHDS